MVASSFHMVSLVGMDRAVGQLVEFSITLMSAHTCSYTTACMLTKYSSLI